MDKKQLYEYVFDYFAERMPEPDTELKYQNPYQLVVAVLLSAQCTDVRVNKITPEFFRRFPTAHELAKATEQEVFQYIKSCSYPNNKARHLVGMARMLVERYGGEVPSDFKELQELPGIGRKSANVIAAIIHKQPRIAVDTHVHRVANRLGLVESKTPLQTEMQLLENIPESLRLKAHHWLILHGRYVCTARNPKCQECGLRAVCKYYKEHNKQKQKP